MASSAPGGTPHPRPTLAERVARLEAEVAHLKAATTDPLGGLTGEAAIAEVERRIREHMKTRKVLDTVEFAADNRIPFNYVDAAAARLEKRGELTEMEEPE